MLLHEDREQLAALLPRIAQFLQERLRLQLHPDKIVIQTFASGVDYLGWVHFTDRRVLRTTTKRRIMRRLRECSDEAMLQPYFGLLSHGNTRKLRGEVLQEYWAYYQ